MTFTLYVDEPRWRAHLQRTVDATPGLVPVIKGNGYGLGNARLAVESAALGVGTVAVGTTWEVDAVQAAFAGDVLVMTPSDGAPDPRVLQTVSHVSTLKALTQAPSDAPGSTRSAAARPRLVLELRTSMQRHGLAATDLAAAVAALGAAANDVALEGLAFHLPIDRHGGYDPAAEVADGLLRAQAAGLPIGTAWVSHLSSTELAGLRAAYPGATFRPRVGTGLWLGDPGALEARGTVLDVHRLSRGEHYGYRRRRAPRDCHLVVVSGGTAHGVALEAPRSVRGPVRRGKELAVGTLAAANLAMSPFRWAGKRRWFAEPPHMQVSMLLLPGSVAPPAIGAELTCDVRHTTLHPDRVAAG